MAATTPAITDTPNQHGMFMLGRRRLFLCHMPMFTMEDHCYQLILRAGLDPASERIVTEDRSSHPHAPYNLINVDDDQFTLPAVQTGDVTSFRAHVYRGYDTATSSPTDQFIDVATVTIDRVIVYRHFDQGIPRPPKSIYHLFGDGDEAHLAHRMSTDPDFQHLLSVPVPQWLDPTQLRAGVTITFQALTDSPTPCTDPIAAGTHSAWYEGNGALGVDIVVPPDATVWFSTGNLLNSHDPCSPT